MKKFPESFLDFQELRDADKLLSKDRTRIRASRRAQRKKKVRNLMAKASRRKNYRRAKGLQ